MANTRRRLDFWFLLDVLLWLVALSSGVVAVVFWLGSEPLGWNPGYALIPFHGIFLAIAAATVIYAAFAQSQLGFRVAICIGLWFSTYAAWLGMRWLYDTLFGWNWYFSWRELFHELNYVVACCWAALLPLIALRAFFGWRLQRTAVATTHRAHWSIGDMLVLTTAFALTCGYFVLAKRELGYSFRLPQLLAASVLLLDLALLCCPSRQH